MATDDHAHFTGSLPLSFVKKMAELRQEVWIPLKAYGVDKAANYQTFFNNYALVQKLTKPRNDREFEQVYREGTTKICRGCLAEGLDGVQIIAGSHTDPAQFLWRIEQMVKGFHDFLAISPTFRPSIRITFIRGKDGAFTNFSPAVLENLLSLLESRSELSEFIQGFDFSGYEDPRLADEVVEIVDEIERWRQKSGLKNKPSISIHSGENAEHGIDLHLTAMDKLITSPIDKFCHATLLWLPASRLAGSTDYEPERQRLLQAIAAKGQTIEICPTANLIMTPLQDYQDIPLNKFKELGIKFTINTDNKALFQTTLELEKQRVGFK